MKMSDAGSSEDKTSLPPGVAGILWSFVGAES